VRFPNSTRVVFQNINGIRSSVNGMKQSFINSWLQKEQGRIALLAETNRHWTSVSEGHGWSDRMRAASKQGFYSATAHNRHQSRKLSKSSFQYGGCSAAVLNQGSHSAKEAGCNPTGLGRWCSLSDSIILPYDSLTGLDSNLRNTVLRGAVITAVSPSTGFCGYPWTLLSNDMSQSREIFRLFWTNFVQD